MQVIPYPEFVGSAYRLSSKNAAADRMINGYTETRQVPGGINDKVTMSTPGLSSVFSTLGDTPVRGMWSGDNRLFSVGGGSLYEIASNGTATLYGSGMPTSSTLPAQIYSNGTQLWIVLSGQSWIANGGALTRPTFTTGLAGTVNTTVAGQVTWVSGDKFSPAMVGSFVTIAGSPYTVVSYVDENHIFVTPTPGLQSGVAYSATLNVNAVSGCYLNGYFIALLPDSNRVCSSNLLDGASPWPDLDYIDRLQAPDRLMAVYSFQGNLWMLGSDTTEVWYPSGADGFPFSPISGAFISTGLWARYSVQDVDTPHGSALIWLASNQAGVNQVVAAQGYGAPAVISTYAIEYAISQNISYDAVAWTYQEQGHSFYVLFLPTANLTFVYDATEGEWHERQYYNSGTPGKQLQWCGQQAFANGQFFVGAYGSGKIWAQGRQYFLDDGQLIQRIRTAPALSQNLGWTVYNYLQLDMEMGLAVAPTVYLEISNDGGQTFGTPHARVGGGVGAFSARLIWNQCGRSMKRVFRVTVEYTAAAVEWSGAYLGITPGAPR